ncbi:hypothetical protein NPIL_576901 [Nephila pilipes]|uniref:Uncharacterized protein n=1 Tax=Nephila pilipes TaxID=299642 RepID=A0A8X6TFK9_NEPPI|nr:hypothetical protein NPIL_576901 [Nephila pilipes]
MSLSSLPVCKGFFRQVSLRSGPMINLLKEEHCARSTHIHTALFLRVQKLTADEVRELHRFESNYVVLLRYQPTQRRRKIDPQCCDFLFRFIITLKRKKQRRGETQSLRTKDYERL